MTKISFLLGFLLVGPINWTAAQTAPAAQDQAQPAAKDDEAALKKELHALHLQLSPMWEQAKKLHAQMQALRQDMSPLMARREELHKRLRALRKESKEAPEKP